MEIKDLEQILSILKNTDISEFELDHDGTHLKLSRGVRQVVAAHAPVGAFSVESAVGAVVPAAESKAAAPDTSHLTKVQSPIVGTFYRKPSPDAENFVKEGDVVKKGDTLCIIEAMKLMNEIDAPCDGRIEKILLTDGKVVEFGETLFLINPNV